MGIAKVLTVVEGLLKFEEHSSVQALLLLGGMLRRTERVWDLTEVTQ